MLPNCQTPMIAAASKHRSLMQSVKSFAIFLNYNLHLAIAPSLTSSLQFTLSALTSWTIVYHLMGKDVTIDAKEALTGLTFVAARLRYAIFTYDCC